MQQVKGGDQQVEAKEKRAVEIIKEFLASSEQGKVIVYSGQIK